ncbi:MAG: phage holin family protein [Micrococcales bacterium]|nr:phage holin family protein [Micrococcales bacterium]
MAHRPIGQLARVVIDDIAALTSDIAALAKSEFSRDAKRIGHGAAFVVIALFTVLLVPLLLVIALANVFIALGLPAWAAYLIDAGVFLVVALALVYAAYRKFRKVTGPKKTMAAIRGTVTALTGPPPEPADDDESPTAEKPA